MVIWVAAVETGRPNAQRAEVVEVHSIHSMTVKMLGNDEVIRIHTSGIVGLEIGELTIRFKPGTLEYHEWSGKPKKEIP